MCEAREVMRWPSEKRRNYYVMVAEKRGEEAARKLTRDVSEAWRTSQTKRPPVGGRR